ncbi:MAG: hypothetical protein ACXVJ7_02195 [Acidimicrobiia bacterium]
MPDLTIVDDEGRGVDLDAHEARTLFALTDDLETATTSACPECRSRVVSVIALADLLDAAPPHPRAGDILELADDAPTLHLYLVDASARCRHGHWRDPGHEEWLDAVAPPTPARRHP